MNKSKQGSLYETPIIKDFKNLSIKLLTFAPNPPPRSTSMSNLLNPSSDDSDASSLQSGITADLKSSPSFLRQQKNIDQLLAEDTSSRHSIYTEVDGVLPRKSKFFSDDNGYEIPIFSKNVKDCNFFTSNNVVKLNPPKLPHSNQKPFIKQKTFPVSPSFKKDVAQVLPRKSLPDVSIMPRVKPISIEDMAVMKQEVLNKRTKILKVRHFSSSEADGNCGFGKEIKRLDDIPIDIDWNTLTVEDIEHFLALSQVDDNKIKVFSTLGIDGVRLKQMSEKMLTMEPFCLNEFFAQQIYSLINGWRPKYSAGSPLFKQKDI